MNKMLTRCAVLAMGAVLATGCVGTLQNPYSGTLDATDPLNDQPVGTDPHGDIDLWGIRYTTSDIVLWMKPAQLELPQTPEWWLNYRTTYGEWSIETTNDDVKDFRVIGGFRNDGTSYAWVEDVQFNKTCSGTVDYTTSMEIALHFDPVTCFGGQGPIRASVDLNDATDTQLTVDKAPASPGWSGWIVPAVPSPTTTL